MVLLIICSIACVAFLTSWSSTKRSIVSWPFSHWAILWAFLLWVRQCCYCFATLALSVAPRCMMPKCLSMSLLLPMTSTSLVDITFTRKP
jgi:hypothetical protein